MLSLFNNRGFRRRRFIIGSFLSAVALAALSFGAHGADQYEPLAIHVEGSLLIPGGTAECRVQMTGGPESVTIYSDPPGVAYQGTLEAASATVHIPVAPNLDTAHVTLYVQSDGQQVVSTTVPVHTAESPDIAARPVYAPSGGLR